MYLRDSLTGIALVILLSWSAIPLKASQQGIEFGDFSRAEGLEMMGGAQSTGSVLRMTEAAPNRAGAAWFHEKQPVGNGFETSFRFQLTGQGGLGRGADGLAFVIQNSSAKALAGRGAAGGFALGDGKNNKRTAGIPFSIAVFFDTFRNEENHDPSDNYISICTSGRPKELRWPPPRLAYTRHLRFDMKDRAVHNVKVVYRPPILSIFVDDPQRAVLVGAIDPSIVTDKEGRAWVGFTASTGAGFENHDILSWSFLGAQEDVSSGMVSSNITFSMSSCLPDRSLCTPERATVEPGEAGAFRVVLPANAEWGASIANPEGKHVLVKDARGTVCWDLEARGADGCNGPDGNGQAAGAGFVAPDARAGALVVKTRDGRSYFSVNDRTGRGFADNEGYFEFEVVLQ
jgi:Legume lectin domain